MNGLSSVYKDKSLSIAPRVTLVVVHFCVLSAAIWFLVGGGIASVDHYLGLTPKRALPVRRDILAVAAALYFSRTLATVFVFVRRKMAWPEVIGIAGWIALFDLLFAYFGGRDEKAFGIWDVVGVVLLLLGSAINTGSELERHLWKLKPESKGHLFKRGLFGYARHINYFGDQLLFIGWVLITGQAGLTLIPVIIACGFIFGSIPAQDRYLEDRYGDEYKEYAKSVKRFIPWMY